MKALIPALVGSVLLTTACATQPSLQEATYGSARLTVGSEEARRVQYVAGDIRAVRVTVRGSVNGGAYSTVSSVDFSGASLASHLTGNAFSFTVDNLRVNDTSTYAYQASVEAYLDTAFTLPLGTSTSEAFGVTTALTPANVSMPTLRLLATPVGSASAALTIIDTPAAPVVIR